MHKIELLKKHANMPKIISEAFELIKDVMKYL